MSSRSDLGLGNRLLLFAIFLGSGLIHPSLLYAIPADLTGDGFLSVSDLQCLVLETLEFSADSQPPCLPEKASADLDCSGETNVVDVQLMVQIILGEMVDEPGMSIELDADQDNIHRDCDPCPDLPWSPLPAPDSVEIPQGCDFDLGDDFKQCPIACTPSLTDLSFEVSTETFINPERGLYQHTKAILPPEGQGYPFLDPTWMSFYRESYGISIIVRIFDLQHYRNAPIPDALIADMHTDMANIREGGLKVIVRFRYYDTPTDYENLEASPQQVLEHIQQLSGLLSEYGDIILTVQAGFIGAWGEWYYTKAFGDLGVFDATDIANRKAVVEALLDALPSDRGVQLRTVEYKTLFYGWEHACFDGSPLARIGHHNDCFLASWSDFGTYKNLETDYPYLHEDTRCTILGGETCTLSVNDGGERTQCPTALSEMAYFHWTYINRYYHPDVMALWEEGGCLEEIVQRLGYRLHLQSTSLPKESSPGDIIPISLVFENHGFAAPVNPRGVALILRNSESQAQWKLNFQVEPREWLPSQDPTTPIAYPVNSLARIPADIPVGNYQLIAHLYDPAPTLSEDGRFAIQLATEGITFEPDSGYNALPIYLEIKEESLGFKSAGFFPTFTAIP